MQYTTVGVKLPVHPHTKKTPLTRFSLQIPAKLSDKHLLAAFALFLHRTSLQEEVLFQTDTQFVKTTLDAQMTFTEFANTLCFVSSAETSIACTFKNPFKCDFGAYFQADIMHIIYNDELFDSDTIERWKNHIHRILQEAESDPHFIAKRFCYMNSEEKKLVLETWNDTIWEFPDDKLLHQFIEEQCEKTPDAEAVRFRGKGISYHELNCRSNQLAHKLRAAGVIADMPVAICMERSTELVIGLLGILKAGGAYVPMDPSYPEDRLLYFLTDSKAQVFLTETSMAGRFNLDSAVQDAKSIQDLEPESLLMGAEHSQKVKAAPIKSDSGSRDCVGLASSTAESRFKDTSITTMYLDDPATLEGWKKENPTHINTSTDLCYVIYTSGSTGKPKGTGNIHKGVVNRILWAQKQHTLLPQDRVLQKTPFGFDVSVWEFFWPLMMGATLVVAEPNVHKDAEALADVIEEEKITTIHFVPSMLRIFLEAEVSQKCHSLLRVIASGEALSSEHQAKFFSQFQAELHNVYGPTEASIDVSHWECTKDNIRSSVPIGRPIANIKLYILDEFLQPVPIGVTGELFIGGVGLARGYIYREELTREKFIPNPFIAGERLYRTGDLCRHSPDGAIEYLGRIDNQLKLRGFRVELGEIEAEIRKHPQVKTVAVIAREDTPGNKYLAAYIRAEGRKEALKQELITKMTSCLPEYMVPSAFVFVDEFPLSPNGKLDIKKLPQPSQHELPTTSEHVEPTSDLESALQGIWQSVLKAVLHLEKIGITDHFFSIGGHSILAMELVLKIKRQLSKRISLPEIFKCPTIKSQALLLQSREIANEEHAALIHRPDLAWEPFSLTDIQRAYFVGRTNAFNLGEIRSHIYVENERDRIDVERLEVAFNCLIKRHDMLRAVILEDATQKILEKTPYYRIQTSSENLEAVRARIQQIPKVSHKWPFFDVRCTHLANGNSVVHFYFDLIIADGTGLEVIFEELSQLYENPEVKLQPIGVSYRDVVVAMEKENESFIKAKEYWHARIDSLPDAPELPTLPTHVSRESHFVRRKGTLCPQAWKKLQEKAATLGVTVAALVATAYGEVLKTWSKSSHFTLNLMFFNRSALHPDINRVVGNFSTTLLLEMNLNSSQVFDERVKHVQEQLLNDLEHGSFNGIKVLNEFNRRQGGSRAAAMPVVFACALNLRPREKQNRTQFFKWYGSRVSYNHLETPQVWFDHQVFEDDDGSFCYFWDVRDGYFPDGIVDQMFEAYEKLLVNIATNTECHSLVPLEDEQLVHVVNNTKTFLEPRCLHEDIVEQSRAYPKKCAILTACATLSYGELLATALKLQKSLSSCNLAPNDTVAIVMDKGWEQVVAALAVHLAGAAYIPVDRALPEERILQILSISHAKAVIAQKPLAFDPKIPLFLVGSVEKESSTLEVPTLLQKPEDLAYVIFTSGSTGVPKGVMIDHQAASNTITEINKKYGVTANDRAFAISSMSFDLSVYDVFGVLGVGGSLYIPTNEEVKNPKLWLDAIHSHQITIWNSAPALMQILMDQAELETRKTSSLRLVCLSGDWIPTALPTRITQHFKATVRSLGGATEASIWSNDYKIDQVDSSWVSIPYGKPLANQTMRVLDANLEPRAVWATGLIYIGGLGLARGYLGDAEKTAKSFIRHPKTQERLYCTGDMGRLRPDGNIEFLGREDLQVKVQGYRIELEEIEAEMNLLDEMQQTIVRIVGAKNEAKRIIAFYTLKRPLDAALIKAHLEKKLPFYMIPNTFLEIESFPLNPNGKIDLKTLVNRLTLQAKPGAEYVPPQGYQEETMCQIWRDLLKVEQIGRTDNFFAIGGTSFLAFQMLHKVQKELQLTLALSTLFQKGTIQELCEEGTSKENPSIVLLQKDGDEPPLFFIHPSGGGVLCYTEVAKLLGNDRPFYGFQSPGYLDARALLHSVEDMADYYLGLLLQKQLEGPYLLGGWSFGGVVAFEMALRLKKMGHEVEPLLLIDSPAPSARKKPSDNILQGWFKEDYGDNFVKLDRATKDSLFKVFKNNIYALCDYKPEQSAIDLIQFKAINIVIDHLREHPAKDEPDWGWSYFSSSSIKSYLFDANHSTILQQPCVAHLAEKIKECATEALVRAG